MGRADEEGTILVVRHGPGLGRMPEYLGPRLESLARRHPDLHRRLRFHHTGATPPEIGDARAVVFWLGDPLRERYPECYRNAAQLAEEATRRGLALVNPPDALSHTIKSVQAARWARAGVPTPEVRRFASRGELEDLVRGMRFPVLVRGDELHAQQSLHVCRERADVHRVGADALALPGIVTELVDVRREFQARHVDGPCAQFFHKRRVCVVGGRVVPMHVYFSDQPIVAKRTSTFLAYKKLRHRGGALAQAGRRPHEACIAEDVAFTANGDRNADLMRRAADALGLGFLAIDYVTFPDGRALLWEANPYFRLPEWRGELLPFKRRAWRRHARFDDAIEGLFRRLLDE